jgi:hypothetical protein
MISTHYCLTSLLEHINMSLSFVTVEAPAITEEGVAEELFKCDDRATARNSRHYELDVLQYR